MRSPIPLGTIDGRSGLSWLHRSHAPRQPLKGGPCDEPRYQEAGALSFRLGCGTAGFKAQRRIRKSQCRIS